MASFVPGNEETSLDALDASDLTTITWAHAVNSKQKLKEAIADGAVRMIEADIVLGTVVGSKTTCLPIMAHPPSTTSDLSLEEFLLTVKETLTNGRGIKLDFKTTQAFEASLGLLTNVFSDSEREFPVWLNADIMSGPGARNNHGLDANLFLSACATRFPAATVSVGWTTKFGTSDDQYLQDDIDRMTEALSKNGVVQPVTFAVRAAFAANSSSTMSRLIRHSSSTTTLTIWCSSPDDITDMDALRDLVNEIGHDRVYLDLTPDMNEAFKSSSGNMLSKCAFVAATTLLAFGNYHMNNQ